MASAASSAPSKATKAELARMLGVSRQAVGDLVRREILSEDKDGKIDVELARLALEQRVRPSSKTAQALNAPAASPAAPPAETDQNDTAITSYHVAKTLNEAAQARINQLKLREMQGDLIQVGAVRSELGSLLASLRESLMQIPSRLSPVVAAETDAVKVHDAIAAEIHQSLEQLTAKHAQMEAAA